MTGPDGGDTAAYPCPACRAAADLRTGCTACGRPPDPEAAEVVALDRVIAGLRADVEAARLALADRTGRLNATVSQRNGLARRVVARTAADLWAARVGAAPPEPRPVAEAPVAEAPVPAARPEASTKAVQNVLFVLGGLLLGSAAVVFTAVAWASFGVVGRAAILGVVTVLVLAVPPVALLRRLAGTAETFAALGLLLVLLDGYAAWYVNLFGVADALPPRRYAALLCALTAATAFGYGRVTGLVGPGLAALLVAQPALPLLFGEAGLGAAGWAGVLAAVALGNLAVVWRSPRSPAYPVIAVMVGTIAYGSAVVAALVALLTSGGAGVAAASRSAAAVAVVAALLVPASLVVGVPTLRHAANGVLTGVLIVAGGHVITTAFHADPGYQLVAAQVVIVALAVRVLPAVVQPGPRVGVLVMAGLFGLVAAVRALDIAVRTAAAAMPAWRADLQPTAERVDWRLPAVLALFALAVAVLLPRAWLVEVAVVAAGLLALAVPASFPLRWWTPSIVDGVVAVPLAVAAGRARSVQRAARYGLVSGFLAGHAALAGLARPVSTVAVLGALVVLAATLAGTGAHRAVGAVAAGTALLALPGLAAAIGEMSRSDARVTLGCAAAGLVLAALALLPLRRWRPVYMVAGAAAVLLGGVGVVVAALAGPAEPFGRYAALAFLCDTVAVVTVLPTLRREQVQVALTVAAVPAGIAFLPALVAVAPATFAVLAAPYTWLGHIWSGTPTGTGLAATGSDLGVRSGGPFGLQNAAVALVLLALAAAVAGRAVRWAAVAPAALAVLTGAAALDARWPTVAALSLAIGVGSALLGARRPSAVLAFVAVATAGAGIAGLLATEPATLTGLAVVTVAATLCGLAGRRLAIRAAGWLVAVVGGATLALASALAADLALRWAALWVLAAAALALGGSAVLQWATRRADARLVEATAHASAAAALLLAFGSLRHMAAVCTIWGLALGLRALWPAEPGRSIRVVAATASELLAYWLLLFANEVSLLEAYTVPAAGVALLGGWLAARARPTLHSWTAYGPALLAGFSPSLAAVLLTPGEPERRLALGIAAVAAVLAGALRRRQAPVIVGGAVLALLAVHEAVLVWDLVPRWIPLAMAGLLLVGLAMTYERRRREIVRLRVTVGRMR